MPPAADTPERAAIAAERVTIIRPFDAHAREALQRLCATTGAKIHAGAVRLADGATPVPALLATDRAGVTLAALLDTTTTTTEEGDPAS